MTTTQPTVWPPAVQHEIAMKSALNFLLMGLAVLTAAGAFVLVPEAPTWRHFLAATLLGIKGALICWNASRMISLTRWGRGRRRRS